MMKRDVEARETAYASSGSLRRGAEVRRPSTTSGTTPVERGVGFLSSVVVAQGVNNGNRGIMGMEGGGADVGGVTCAGGAAASSSFLGHETVVVRPSTTSASGTRPRRPTWRGGHQRGGPSSSSDGSGVDNYTSGSGSGSAAEEEGPDMDIHRLGRRRKENFIRELQERVGTNNSTIVLIVFISS